MQRNDLTKKELKKLEASKRKGKSKVGTTVTAEERLAVSAENSAVIENYKGAGLETLPMDMLSAIAKLTPYNDALKLMITCKLIMSMFLATYHSKLIIHPIKNPYVGPANNEFVPRDENTPETIDSTFVDARKIVKHANEISASIQFLKDDIETLMTELNTLKTHYAFEPVSKSKYVGLALGLLVYLGLVASLSVMSALTPDREYHNNPKRCASESNPDRKDCSEIDYYGLGAILSGIFGLALIPGGALLVYLIASCCCQDTMKETMVNKKSWNHLVSQTEKLIAALQGQKHMHPRFGSQIEQLNKIVTNLKVKRISVVKLKTTLQDQLAATLNVLSILMQSKPANQSSMQDKVRLFSGTQPIPHTVVEFKKLRQEIKFDHSDKASQLLKKVTRN